MVSGSERLVDKMPFQLSGIDLANGPAARGLACLMHRFTATGDQIMPIGQGLAFPTKAVRASRRKPFQLVQLVRIKLHAIVDQLLAVAIVGALPSAPIQQLAGDVGREELAGILIFQLVKTAAPASVAQRLPLATVE